MREAYIAEDGKIFDSKEDCKRYEYFLSMYELGSVKNRADKIIKEYERICNDYRSDTKELQRERKDTFVFSPQHIVGVMFLVDDAVDILIERIRELENTYEPQ